MLNGFLLVLPDKKTKEIRPSGIYVDTEEDNGLVGVVTDLDSDIEDIGMGDRIQCKDHEAIVNIDGMEYYIVNVEDVLCVLE
jgi:co-chaperonin GroES (HSP10)